MGFCRAAISIALLILSLSPVHAAENGKKMTKSEIKEQARAAFNRGTELFEKEDYEAAADAFREANKLNPSWKILYNIGQAEAAAKHYGRALEAFEAYLAKGGDEIGDRRTDEVISEVKRLREVVGSLEINAPPGSSVQVDGQERGVAPLAGPIKVAAGIAHKVTAIGPDGVIDSQTVRTSGGYTIKVNLRAAAPEPAPQEPEEPIPPPPPPVEEEGISPFILWGWVATGAGAALLATAGITGGLALSMDTQLADDCTEGLCIPKYHGDIDTRDNLAITSTVFFVAGGVFAAGGITLLLLGYLRDESPTESITIAPAAGPQMTGVLVTGRF